MYIMEDIYKAIGNELNNSLNCKWDKIELNIECSNNHVGTTAKYQINGEWKNNLDCDLTRDTMISIIKFHNNADKINFAPWNRAVYTLDSNGHFDMTFEWDQTLQDEWDKKL
nr:hypothetical protein [uncultured Treponema sp.]